MSKVTQYIKRCLQYVISGQPIVQVSPLIVTLAPNELLLGRTALITGGTKGIGKAIAISFLKAGANVIITSRSQTNADMVAAELQEQFPRAYILGVQMDSGNVEQIRDKFASIVSQLEQYKIDILVNNAGILAGNLGNTSEKEWNEVIDVNLKGVFFLSEIVAKYMKDNHIEGNILMVASSSSLRPAVSAYTISKWGLRGFVLGLAKICAPYGIIVNGVAPGPTATSMLQKNDTTNIILKDSPIKRYALPEEIANMATILCSNMGKTIVGDIVYMTGGAGLITFDDMKYTF